MVFWAAWKTIKMDWREENAKTKGGIFHQEKIKWSKKHPFIAYWLTWLIIGLRKPLLPIPPQPPTPTTYLPARLFLANCRDVSAHSSRRFLLNKLSRNCPGSPQVPHTFSSSKLLVLLMRSTFVGDWKSFINLQEVSGSQKIAHQMTT